MGFGWGARGALFSDVATRIEIAGRFRLIRCVRCNVDIRRDVDALLLLIPKHRRALDWSELAEHVTRTIAHAYNLQQCTECSPELARVTLSLRRIAAALQTRDRFNAMDAL
jgi:hypothetical protein